MLAGGRGRGRESKTETERTRETDRQRGRACAREQVAAECRVGGMLAGKAGLLYCHVGTGPGMLEPLREVTNNLNLTKYGQI